MENLKRMSVATSAGVGATICCHPLDVIRVNLQVDTAGKYAGAVDCALQVLREQGMVRGLYAGISAGMLRQVMYGMPRMSIYPALMDVANPTDGSPLSFGTKLGLGSIAGGIAAAIGVPSEVALVRMSADSKLPAAERRGYTSVIDALARVGSEEGVSKLWAGAAPTVARAALLNAGQFGVYSEAKERITQATGGQLRGLALQFTSSLVSATAAIALSCPADVLKSRMQMAAPGTYSGLGDALTSLLRNEGPLALYSGAIPATIKLAPHTVISFVILENLTRMVFGREAM